MPSEPPVTRATLPDRSGTASSENWFSGDASSLPGMILPRFSAMVFLMASIPGIGDFVVTGPFSRSVFSVEYGLVDNRVAKARKGGICLVVLRNTRAGLNSFKDCIFRWRCRSA